VAATKYNVSSLSLSCCLKPVLEVCLWADSTYGCHYCMEGFMYLNIRGGQLDEFWELHHQEAT